MKFTIKLLLIFSIITSCDNSSKNPDITIVDKSIDSIIDSEAKIEILVDSLLLSEGPLWDKLNNSLIFTDVAQNKIFKWNSEDGVNEYMDLGNDLNPTDWSIAGNVESRYYQGGTYTLMLDGEAMIS